MSIEIKADIIVNVGSIVGRREGNIVKGKLVIRDGEVDLMVGLSDGIEDEVIVGLIVGYSDENSEGRRDGVSDGSIEGIIEAVNEGSSVGISDGIREGKEVVGYWEGSKLGSIEGMEVGW